MGIPKFPGCSGAQICPRLKCLNLPGTACHVQAPELLLYARVLRSLQLESLEFQLLMVFSAVEKHLNQHEYDQLKRSFWWT